MTTPDVAPAGPATAGDRTSTTVKSRTATQLVVRRFFAHKLAVGSLVVFLLLVIGAIVIPYFWHYSYKDLNAPLSKGPSGKNPFGTDSDGHDLFAQVLQGMRTSLKVAFVGVVIGEAAGIILGGIAGFYRGWIDSVLMRLVDIILTFPAIVLAAVLAKATGGSWLTVAVILGGLGAGPTARLIRSVVLSLREREYIEAARALGATDVRIMVRHLLPNALGPLIVDVTLNIAIIMLSEAALSFLGFGIQPPDISLGGLVSDGVNASSTRPWLFYIPGLVLVGLVLTVNFIGDGLRDAFDPTQRRVR
ncbi:MAG TPA: ABC transporter permease [Mycobacteriales bacterium]|nr:ABC transporter permease [Mycobacteriales bacterium]